MEHLKWRIKAVKNDNQNGYVVLPKDEAGTVLIHSEISEATVIGPCTRDYVDGLCKGLYYAFDEQYIPVPAVHIDYPKTPSESYAKVDDNNAGE